MILKASQRGGGAQLGAHLLKAENEHVEVHEVRGFVSGDVKGAMKEAQAVALGTRCKQYLFSVSLNPPASESVPVATFESAIGRVEAANGLTGQPRIVVFHEKDGRRHCHAVWSRVDADTMKAVPLPYFKTRLQEVSKALYLEHGWRMPRGLIDRLQHDPRNFSLAEWQQAKRVGRDPKLVKAAVQDCWAISDSLPSFSKALEECGLYLAKGDRRGHVVLTFEGEIISVARMLGKSAIVRAKLGAVEDARSLEKTRSHIAATIAPRLQELVKETKRARRVELTPLHERRHAMKLHHTAERQKLDEGQQVRAVREAKERAARLRGGVMGVWDRLIGRHGRTVKQNNAEALASIKRDRTQRDELVSGQLDERRGLQRDILAVRHRHAASVLELHRDLAQQTREGEPKQENARDSFADAARGSSSVTQPAKAPREIVRGRSGGRNGPDLGR